MFSQITLVPQNTVIVVCFELPRYVDNCPLLRLPHPAISNSPDEWEYRYTRVLSIVLLLRGLTFSRIARLNTHLYFALLHSTKILFTLWKSHLLRCYPLASWFMLQYVRVATMYPLYPDHYQGKIGHAIQATTVSMAGVSSSKSLHTHTRQQDTTMTSIANIIFAAKASRAIHLNLTMHSECLRGPKVPPASPCGHGNPLAIHIGNTTSTAFRTPLGAFRQREVTLQDLLVMNGMITHPVTTRSIQQWSIAELKRRKAVRSRWQHLKKGFGRTTPRPWKKNATISLRSLSMWVTARRIAEKKRTI